MSGETENQPSSWTTDSIHELMLRLLASERDYVNNKNGILEERLNGIDRATVVLNDIVTKVPTDVQKEVMHLRELALEKFTSVETQFRERDNRSERESKDNKVAVDAAFAAQKEAASEQNKSNTLAIAKSEASTIETINKLSELFKTTTDGLSVMVTQNARTLTDKIEDLKDLINKLEIRIGKIENLKLGAAEQTHQSQNSISQFLAVLGAVVAVVSIAVAVMIATRGGG